MNLNEILNKVHIPLLLL